MKITVWTVGHGDFDARQPRPVPTTCEESDFLDKMGSAVDEEGRRMFINTHFRTEAEAWTRLAENADAHTNHCARQYRQAQAQLVKATQELADTAAFACEVREARKKAGM